VSKVKSRPKWRRVAGEWHVATSFIGLGVAFAAFGYFRAALVVFALGWVASLVADALLNRRELAKNNDRPPLLIETGSRVLNWMFDRQAHR
jgi:hypothetical protein